MHLSLFTTNKESINFVHNNFSIIIPFHNIIQSVMIQVSKRLRNKLTEDDQMLNVKIKNSVLEQVLTYKLFGITIDQELTFDDHVESITEWQIGTTHKNTEVNTLPSSSN